MPRLNKTKVRFRSLADDLWKRFHPGDRHSVDDDRKLHGSCDLCRSRPRRESAFSIGSPSIASALTVATLSFGSETGGTANGLESNAQIIEIAATSVPPGGTAGVTAARNGALASGVEMINTIALGNRAATVENYYAANMIGGEAGGVLASSSTSSINGGLAGMLTNQLSGGVAAGAAESLSAVPEPSTSLALLSSVALLLVRRRQH